MIYRKIQRKNYDRSVCIFFFKFLIEDFVTSASNHVATYVQLGKRQIASSRH